MGFRHLLAVLVILSGLWVLRTWLVWERDDGRPRRLGGASDLGARLRRLVHGGDDAVAGDGDGSADGDAPPQARARDEADPAAARRALRERGEEILEQDRAAGTPSPGIARLRDTLSRLEASAGAAPGEGIELRRLHSELASVERARDVPADRLGALERRVAELQADRNVARPDPPTAPDGPGAAGDEDTRAPDPVASASEPDPDEGRDTASTDSTAIGPAEGRDTASTGSAAIGPAEDRDTASTDSATVDPAAGGNTASTDSATVDPAAGGDTASTDSAAVGPAAGGDTASAKPASVDPAGAGAAAPRDAGPAGPGDVAPLFDRPDERDDLQRIKGIGPVMEGVLNRLGVTTFRQLAAFTKNDIERVSAAIGTFPDRIERDDWIGQARTRLREKRGEEV